MCFPFRSYDEFYKIEIKISFKLISIQLFHFDNICVGWEDNSIYAKRNVSFHFKKITQLQNAYTSLHL